jgi:hypothetical protein
MGYFRTFAVHILFPFFYFLFQPLWLRQTVRYAASAGPLTTGKPATGTSAVGRSEAKAPGKTSGKPPRRSTRRTGKQLTPPTFRYTPNPWEFGRLYRLYLLERCWEKDSIALLERCWRKDYA